VNVPGIRARSYNKFTGSINAIGAVPTYKHLKLVISTLNSKKAAKFMRDGDYEIMSISPTGALFGFVVDKSINTPEKMAGKKITVLDNAPESQFLVSQTGMTPVSSTINNAIQKFNNHTVDITGAPAIAYEPMEMYKGLEPDGGVISWPFLQTTMQIVGRWEKLPAGFGQKSREYTQNDLDSFIELAKASEAVIPAKYWIPISDEVKNNWNETFRQNRIALRDKGIYDGKALSLYRKVRCKVDPGLAECTAADRE
jgi:TRAP-type C4-dicarboxylate transport system substrate-binding protein